MKTDKKSMTSKKTNKVNPDPSEKSQLSISAMGQETEMNHSPIAVTSLFLNRKETTASRNINDPVKYSFFLLPPFI